MSAGGGDAYNSQGTFSQEIKEKILVLQSLLTLVVALGRKLAYTKCNNKEAIPDQ